LKIYHSSLGVYFFFGDCGYNMQLQVWSLIPN
jgi:hypothetical protein